MEEVKMTDTKKLRELAEDVGGAANWKCEPRGSTWKHGPLNYCRKPFELAEQTAALCDELDALREERDRMREALETLKPYAKFGLAVSESWPSEFGDIDAFDVFDMLKESGVIAKQPEPYDPDHHDYIEDCEPGDEWYKRVTNIGNVRAALGETK
jgi:hypothetical protein